MKKQTKIWVGIVVAIVLVAGAILAANPALFKGSFRLPRRAPASFRIPPGMLNPPRNLYVTRGELARLVVEELMRAPIDPENPLQLVLNPRQHFNDVPSDNPNFLYIETAFAQDWIHGDDDKMFRPDRVVTRAEFAVYATHIFGLNNNLPYPNGAPQFVDNIQRWAVDRVKAIYAVGAVKIDYRPSDSLERSFATEVLRNMPRGG